MSSGSNYIAITTGVKMHIATSCICNTYHLTLYNNINASISIVSNSIYYIHCYTSVCDDYSKCTSVYLCLTTVTNSFTIYFPMDHSLRIRLNTAVQSKFCIINFHIHFWLVLFIKCYNVHYRSNYRTQFPSQ